MEAQILEIQELGLTAATLRRGRYKTGAHRAPVSFQPSFPVSPISVEAMMSMVVMAPMVVAPVAIVTDPPRAIIGPDDPAVTVRVIIVGRRIVGRRIVEVLVKMVVPEREPAVAKAAAVENMRGSKPGAVKHRAAASGDAAMKDCTMEAVAAMTAVDFGRQPVGGVFRYRRSTRIDQRQRFGALAKCGRQHQHRGSPNNGQSRARDLESSSCVKPPLNVGDESGAAQRPALGTFICGRSQH